MNRRDGRQGQQPGRRPDATVVRRDDPDRVAGLIAGAEVAPSRLGLIVTALSLLVMPFLGGWKLRLARRMGSRGLEAEAKETIACAYLSFFAVLGVGIRYLGGPSWVDAVAALSMVPWLIREGLERVRGEEAGSESEEERP